MHTRIKQFLFMGLLLGMPVIGWSLSMFDFAKICLFSEVNGVVLKDGEPIAKVEIDQLVMKSGKAFHQRATSNAKGEFKFEAVYTKSLSAIMPVEPAYAQKISIKQGNDSVLAWSMLKHDNEVNTELDGKPIQLRCDVTSEDTQKNIGANNIIPGVCTWE